jgi:hypothetical protein
VFLGVFANVSNACSKCFIYLQMYVVSVAFEYFKSRSGVASPSSAFAASPRCPLLLPVLVGHPIRHRGHCTPQVLPNQRCGRAPPSLLLLDAGDVQVVRAPAWDARNGVQACAFVQSPSASSAVSSINNRLNCVCWIFYGLDS